MEHPADLALLDLSISEMNEANFLKHLCKLDSNVPVMVVAGYPQSDLMDEAMQYGPMLLLPEPIGKLDLPSTVAAGSSIDRFTLRFKAP